MKIYTKTGDQGETGLLGGLRVSKSHPTIQITGSLDETNSWLGVAGSEKLPEEIAVAITQIQHDLFDLGSRVAGCLSQTSRVAEFPAERAVELEQMIDRFQAELPPLTAFILPSGSRAGSTFHLARSVCRRAERELVELLESDLKWPSENPARLQSELVYLNRLSDLLFVVARYVNQAGGCPETQWNVSRKKCAD